MRRLATGYGLVEGPLWAPDRGLLFSDVLFGGISCLTPEGKVEAVFEHRRGVGGDGQLAANHVFDHSARRRNLHRFQVLAIGHLAKMVPFLDLESECLVRQSAEQERTDSEGHMHAQRDPASELVR